MLTIKRMPAAGAVSELVEAGDEANYEFVSLDHTMQLPTDFLNPEQHAMRREEEHGVPLALEGLMHQEQLLRSLW